MTEPTRQSPPDAPAPPPQGDAEDTGKEFHPWRLLAGLLGFIALLAVVAAIIDIAVLGW